MRLVGLLLAWLLCSCALAADPQLRVQAQLLGGDSVVVGETVQLQLDVLTDTWFTGAPQLPTLSVPGALVTPPGDQAQHLTLNLDGSTWFGMRYLYPITVQQAGTLDIPALTVTARPGNAAAALSATTAALHLRVQLPTGVQPGQAVLVASALSLTQQVNPASRTLKVGDSLTRSVTLQAQGAPSLMLPVTALQAVPGLSLYLKTPQVQALDDGHGHVVGGQRIDTASYRIEQPGSYQLPAVQVHWWSTTEKALRSTTLPAVPFTASAGPAYTPVFSVADDLQRLGQQGRLHLSRHWLGAALVLAALGLAWRVWRSRGPTWLARWRHWQARRQARRLASAEHAWQQVPVDLARHPPQLTALYLWFRRSQGSVRLATADDTTLLALLRRGYGADGAPDTLLAALKAELAQLHARHSPRQPAAPARHGLRPLNPMQNRESR